MKFPLSHFCVYSLPTGSQAISEDLLVEKLTEHAQSIVGQVLSQAGSGTDLATDAEVKDMKI